MNAITANAAAASSSQERARPAGTLSASGEFASSVGPIEYHISGPESAPVLLFVHGLFTNMQLWRKLVPQLSQHYRLVLPTLPFGGHRLPVEQASDLSPPALAGLIFELIDGLGLRDVTIVANDTGGALTQIALTQQPDHPAIRSVLFTNCDAFEVFPPAIFVYLRWISHLPLIPTLLAWQMRLDFVRRLPIALGSLTKYRVPSEILDLYTDPFIRNRAVRKNTTKILRDIHKRYTLAAAGELHRFRKPVRFAWAPEDRLFPRRLAERLQAIFPDSSIGDIADSGCFIAEDQPEALVAEIQKFVSAAK